MKKFLSVILIVLLVAVVWLHPVCAPYGEKSSENRTDKVIRIWYTDEELSSYMDNAAISYYNKTGIHVQPKLVSGLEYLEGINEATLHEGEYPDLYVVGNESLEKAILSGLATSLEDPSHILNTGHYPQIALDAVTYQGDYIGYPFYYETSVFLYNRTYLEAIAAQAAAEQEVSAQAEEDAQDDMQEEEVQEDAQTEDAGAEPEVITADSILPTSMVGILEFANSYDPPDGMEAFLKWDVTDILYNYGFAGAYMDVGGPAGDDRTRIDIYNGNAMYALGVYQDFNQFFSIETEEISYDSVVQEFMEGKIMFTFANTGVIEELEQAKADGTMSFEYGIAPMEMLNTTLQAKPLSITNAIVVNGYSPEKEIAEDFAAYLSGEYVSNLFARSGKLCAYALPEYEYEAMKDARLSYNASVPIPKFVESGNYWVLAELCYTNIWEGEDVNETLKEFAEHINSQVLGETAEPITEIPTPEVVESYIQSE